MVRFFKSNWRYPDIFYNRTTRFIRNKTRRKIFSSWVKLGVYFKKKYNICDFSFKNKSVFFKTDNNLNFEYLPELGGGTFDIEFHNEWESTELMLLCKTTKKKGIFFDIGANFGWYSINLCVNNCTKVYAFEPGKSAFNVLVKNIERNNLQNNIIPVKSAIGDKNKNVIFTKSDFFGNYVSLKKAENGEKVPMITIDDYVVKNKIKTIDSIKCDIEGAELLMLRGARQSIKKFKPVILLEIETEWPKRFGYLPEEIFEFLSELNYNYYRITNDGEIKRPINDRKKELREGHNFFFIQGNL